MNYRLVRIDLVITLDNICVFRCLIHEGSSPMNRREVDHDLSQPASSAVDKLRTKETRKKWSPKVMEDAMVAVKNKQMTVF